MTETMAVTMKMMVAKQQWQQRNDGSGNEMMVVVTKQKR